MEKVKGEISGGRDVDHSDCGYYAVAPWMQNYACQHSNEYTWCEGCLRVEGVKRPKRRRRVSNVDKSRG